MTTPNQARTRGRDAPRTYAWPPLPPHEFEVVSVTSAKDVYPKPWLVPWAAKVTAETAVDKYELLGRMIAEDSEKAAIDWLKASRSRNSGDKADRGTIVHATLEAYLAGREMEPEAVDAMLAEKRVPRPLWKSTHVMAAGLMDFLHDEEPEVFWSESTVYSRTHGYAGTPDILGRMRVGGSLQNVVIDVKTSKSIYNDTALQTCGYARADFVGLDDGTEKPLAPNGEPFDYGVVVRPKPSGGYEPATFVHTDELFECFLACLAVLKTKAVVDTAKRP